MAEQVEVARETAEINARGRTTIPKCVRKAIGLLDKKAWCQFENYGKDKIVITIMNRYEPPQANKGIRSQIKTV
jgi:bifunctional DNA-binding transcriptional regulator/antitoxin component of YhaV-PrlF toxin-antitoxin module